MQAAKLVLKPDPVLAPVSGDRKPARTLAGKADGTDVLLGKRRISTSPCAQLNTHANASCESFMKTLKREEIYANKYDDLEHLRANIEESSSSITIGCACTPRWAIDLPKSSSNRSRRQVGRSRSANDGVF